MAAVESCVRVMLVEDHQMVREGVAAMLASDGDIRIVGQVASVAELMATVDALRPDVVVMDVELPDLDGVEATRQLCARPAAPRVVMLSMHDDAATVGQSLRAGAQGYVLKGQSVRCLREAIRAVHGGRGYLSPEVSGYVIAGFAGREEQGLDRLTDREREVLALIATGLTSAEVAERLGLKTKTVQNHRTNLMDKLDIRSTAGLVRYALRQGLAR